MICLLDIFIYCLSDITLVIAFITVELQILKDEESRKDYDYMLDNPGNCHNRYQSDKIS